MGGWGWGGGNQTIALQKPRKGSEKASERDEERKEEEEDDSN